jgi:protein-S-isoprenylcysteine O-methyltransferase Ste14
VNDSTQPGGGTAGVIAYPPHVLAGAVGMGLLLRWAWPHPLAGWPTSVALGLVAGAASAALALWARRHFLDAGTPIHPGDATTAIVTTGPYARTRNPLYVAQGLLLVMAAGLSNSAAVLVMLVPWAGVMQFGVIAREERYLAERFGETYRSYRSRVRRWL